MPAPKRVSNHPLAPGGTAVPRCSSTLVEPFRGRPNKKTHCQIVGCETEPKVHSAIQRAMDNALIGAPENMLSD